MSLLLFFTPTNASPTVALNSPADAGSTSDTTPTLEFTGTDAEGSDVRYQVQISTTTAFVVGGVVDSWASSNQSNFFDVHSATRTEFGQSFTVGGEGGTLNTAKFFIKKNGAPTGNATAKIYAHSGTYGTSSVPTGSPLATSDNFNVATLTTSFAMTTFTFTGGNKITLSPYTNYIVVIVYSGGDASNFIDVGTDSSPAHSGNTVYFTSPTWTAYSDDTIFEVSVDTGTVITNVVSGTDAGFANTVTGGDTDPFNNGEKASYTVQSPLSLGTYYWRVRGIDPSGSNVYGDWTAHRSFTVTSAAVGDTRNMFFGAF